MISFARLGFRRSDPEGMTTTWHSSCGLRQSSLRSSEWFSCSKARSSWASSFWSLPASSDLGATRSSDVAATASDRTNLRPAAHPRLRVCAAGRPMSRTPAHNQESRKPMKFKRVVVFGTGVAAGYVAGAAAGRQRYEQIVNMRSASPPRRVWPRPRTGSVAGRVTSRVRLPTRPPRRHGESWRARRTRSIEGWPPRRTPWAATGQSPTGPTSERRAPCVSGVALPRPRGTPGRSLAAPSPTAGPMVDR